MWFVQDEYRENISAFVLTKHTTYSSAIKDCRPDLNQIPILNTYSLQELANLENTEIPQKYSITNIT